MQRRKKYKSYRNISESIRSPFNIPLMQWPFNTALISASGNGHTSTVELLLAHGADPDIMNSVSTFLIYLFLVHHRESSSPYNTLSISYRQWGCTALAYASERGHTTIVELLITRGTNPNIQNVVSIISLFSSV